MVYGNYPDLSQVKKVLVIKLRHHGDVLLTAPVFSNLKAAIPGAALHAMVYHETIPMLEGHRAIEGWISYDRRWKRQGFFRRIASEISLLKKIRKEKYDLVINLTEGDRGAIVAFVSGASIRVGFDPEQKGFKGKRTIYTHLVKPCKTARHTVEKNLDALRRIGIFPEPHERGVAFHIPEESRERVKKMVEGHTPFIVLHPVSRWRFKCWPVARAAALIEELHKRGETVVLTASPDRQEMSMIDEIVALVPHVPVVNLAGKTTLKELGALIEMSRSLICVDSVPLHISSGLQKRVVVLFGPSSELNWGPWQNRHARVVTEPLPCRPCFLDGCGGSKVSDCLATLSVQKVLQALDSQ